MWAGSTWIDYKGQWLWWRKWITYEDNLELAIKEFSKNDNAEIAAVIDTDRDKTPLPIRPLSHAW
jgi:hypothetical protein